jgi:hypothetical protein
VYPEITHCYSRPFPGAKHIGPGTIQTNILLFLACPEGHTVFHAFPGQVKLLFLAFSREYYYIRSFLLGLAAAIFFINLLLLFISPLLERNCTMRIKQRHRTGVVFVIPIFKGCGFMRSYFCQLFLHSHIHSYTPISLLPSADTHKQRQRHILIFWGLFAVFSNSRKRVILFGSMAVRALA